MPEITLAGGHTLRFDAVDAHLIAGRPWHALRGRDTWYAQAGDNTSIYLHRLILNPAPGLVVDHINRNGLDNRRSNLRTATHSQNHANRGLPRHNTSGYKGVRRKRDRWAARITVDYHERHLGVYTTPEEAAAAYNRAALAAWGEFALLNVIPASAMTIDSPPD